MAGPNEPYRLAAAATSQGSADTEGTPEAGGGAERPDPEARGEPTDAATDPAFGAIEA